MLSAMCGSPFYKCSIILYAQLILGIKLFVNENSRKFRKKLANEEVAYCVIQ